MAQRGDINLKSHTSMCCSGHWNMILLEMRIFTILANFARIQKNCPDDLQLLATSFSMRATKVAKIRLTSSLSVSPLNFL